MNRTATISYTKKAMLFAIQIMLATLIIISVTHNGQHNYTIINYIFHIRHQIIKQILRFSSQGKSETFLLSKPVAGINKLILELVNFRKTLECYK